MNNDRIAAIRERYEKAAVCCWGDEVNASFYDIPYLLTEIDRLTAEHLALVDIAGRYEQLKEKHKKLMADADNLEADLAASQRREQAMVSVVESGSAMCTICANRKGWDTCKPCHFEMSEPQEGGE